MSKIMQILWDWLRNMERRRKDGGALSSLSASGNRDACFDGSLETNYSGGLNKSMSSFLIHAHRSKTHSLW